MISAEIPQNLSSRPEFPACNGWEKLSRTPSLPLRRPDDRLGLTERSWQFAGVCLDALLVFLNSALIFRFRFESATASESVWKDTREIFALPEIDDQFAAFLFLYVTLMVLALASQNLYGNVRAGSTLDEMLAVQKAVLLATGLLAAFIYISHLATISGLAVGAAGVFNAFTLAAWRAGRRRVIERRRLAGTGTRNVLIVGAGAVGRQMAGYLAAHREFGFVVQGFLDGSASGDPGVLGRVEDLARVARKHFVDEIFITAPLDRELVRAVALEARRQHLDVRLVPELYGGLAWCSPLDYLGQFPLITLYREPIPALGMMAKRFMDILFSAAGLLLLAPLLAAIALAIKLDSPGPALYCSLRVGRKGRRFLCRKFRSMAADADARKDYLRHLNERRGPTFKIANDPRVTRLGRLLRKYSLDELPQLWNVLRGDMSLVGPRPHPTDDCAQYQLEHLRRLDVTPGLTGLWQVRARRDPSFERNMALDLEYIENWNFWLDFKIVLRTLPVLFHPAGD